MKKRIATETELGGLYYLDNFPLSFIAAIVGVSSLQWHHRLGHPSTLILQQLLLSFRSTSPIIECEACQLSKHHRFFFLASNERRSTTPFALIRSDN